MTHNTFYPFIFIFHVVEYLQNSTGPCDNTGPRGVVTKEMSTYSNEHINIILPFTLTLILYTGVVLEM